MGASIISIILFVVYTWGLGNFISLFAKESEDWLERNIMKCGLGLSLLILLATIMNMLKIPLYWWIFLILAVIFPIVTFIKNKKINFPNIKLTKKNIIYFLLILLFLFNLYTYTKGSFSYEYLEDEDPYAYAEAMKYVAVEKKLDYPYFRTGNHLDPFPPAYSIIMGLMHQTSKSANWTIKFFNSLIISIGILFFFFMAKELMKNRTKALLATFVLSMLPSYLSHFIWAHILIPTLFFALIYYFERTDHDKKNYIISTIVIAAICLTHITNTIKVIIMAIIYLIIKMIYNKKLDKQAIISIVLGFILSLSWWVFKYKGIFAMATADNAPEDLITVTDTTSSFLSKFFRNFLSFFNPTGGTATRAYTFSDFFIAQKGNMINSPIGIGIVISIITILALIIIIFKYKLLFKKSNYWITATIIWLIFTFIGLNTATFHLPVGMVAFRFWMLLAIPVSILSAIGIYSIMKFSKNFKYIILIIIIIGIILTSGYQKYYHNTTESWPPGGKWTSQEEIEGYTWMRDNLPIDTNVFTFHVQNKLVLAFDMFACVWCEDYRKFKEGILKKDITEVYTWLKANNYKYVIFSGMDYKYFGNEYGDENATKIVTQKIDEIGSMSDKFQVAHQNKGFIAFRII